MANFKRGNKVEGNKAEKKKTKLRGEDGGERENVVIFSEFNNLEEKRLGRSRTWREDIERRR